MRVFLVGLTLLLPACAAPPMDDPSTTHHCDVTPVGLVECHERA